MKTVKSICGVKEFVKEFRRKGKSIGFVPTMGYLHAGHLSLVQESARRCDCTIVSIFVNPTQFAPNEDFNKYPRNIQGDIEVLEKEGVDLIFIPGDGEMYPEGYKTYVEVKNLQDRLCGGSRPGFFKGVCTVVLKLFNIVRPDISFFGQKDAQQAVILKKMACDLNLDVKIEALPIIREKSGLALSSRNEYLDNKQKKAALCLSRSLARARKMVEAGEKNAARVLKRIKTEIESEPLARIDYVEIVDSENLQSLKQIKDKTLIAVAVFIDNVRLIDNIIVKIRRRKI
jgi:pantoate--beta-alanine ligase